MGLRALGRLSDVFVRALRACARRADPAITMRMPFRLALAFCAFLALLVSFWLFVGLVLLFGRAALVNAHRRSVRGELANLGIGRAQQELPGEAGDVAEGASSPLEMLPFP